MLFIACAYTPTLRARHFPFQKRLDAQRFDVCACHLRLTRHTTNMVTSAVSHASVPKSMSHNGTENVSAESQAFADILDTSTDAT